MAYYTVCMESLFGNPNGQPLIVPELLDKMEHYRYLIQDQPLDPGETKEDAYIRGGQFYEAHIFGGGYTPLQIMFANHVVFSESDEEFYGHPD